MLDQFCLLVFHSTTYAVLGLELCRMLTLALGLQVGLMYMRAECASSLLAAHTASKERTCFTISASEREFESCVTARAAQCGMPLGAGSQSLLQVNLESRFVDGSIFRSSHWCEEIDGMIWVCSTGCQIVATTICPITEDAFDGYASVFFHPLDGWEKMSAITARR